MWIVIIIAFILFTVIRGIILSSGTFKVVNRDGVSFHLGSFSECSRYAKSQNDYFKALGIDEKYKVVKTNY